MNTVSEPKERLKELSQELESLGISQAEVARTLGKGTSTISRLFSGEEPKKSGVYIRAVENIIKTKTRKPEPALTSKLFSPKPQQRAVSLLKQAGEKHMMGLLVGHSGVGKTYACKAAAEMPGVVYAKMRKNISPNGIVDLITVTVREYARCGNYNSKLDHLIDDLKTMQTNLLIIDEADLFCDDEKLSFIRKYEVFRDLYEAGFSVVLVGLMRLADKLKGIGEDYIARRIKLCYPIELNLTDIESYYDFLGLPEVKEKTGICERAHNNGNLGLIRNISEQFALFGDIKVANNLVFSTKNNGGYR